MQLLKKTRSLCPVCLRTISAEIVESEGKIFLKKNCPEDGNFVDLYYGNADMYHEFMKYSRIGKEAPGHLNGNHDNCPYDCGLCEYHKSSSVLANIDVTNACNFRCPICFANAAASGYVYNPPIHVISRMMDALRNQDPPCAVLQLSGGEPTVREDFLDIANLAHEKGFAHIQVATNGHKLARDPEYAKELRQAHVRTVYLQFDGVTPDPYVAARGFNALPQKLKALENMRRNGRVPNAVLVPTLVKGVNDHQIGDIIRFAADNIDAVQGVNFQPVSYTGRISTEELLSRRITIADFVSALETQLDGQITPDDFFPIPIFVPLLELLKRINDNAKYPELYTHPVCGAWTYVFKDGDELVPLNRVINIEAVFELIGLLKTASRTEITAKIAARLPGLLRRRTFRYAPKILSVLKNIILKGSYQAAIEFHDRNVLFVGAMHFMDPYNFDCDRIERCCIHYAAADGRIVPFCSYNIIYREKVEREFAGRTVPGPGC